MSGSHILFADFRLKPFVIIHWSISVLKTSHGQQVKDNYIIIIIITYDVLVPVNMYLHGILKS